MKTKPFEKIHRHGGFTLIEVTLAVGIAAVALVSLMAMIPQGMQAMKRATDTAVEARIHQQIISELSLASWKDRDVYNKQIRYFDDQGIQVTEEDHRRDPLLYNIVYAARILVPEDGDNLPERLGSRTYSAVDSHELRSGTGEDEDELQLVIVEVSSSPGADVWKDSDFDKVENWAHIHTYKANMTRLIDRRELED